MRCGRKMGMREPMRRNSTCGIARSLAEEEFKFIVAQEQWVAAAEEDVADRGRAADVINLFGEFGMKIVAAGVADEARAGAIPAVAGATVGDEEEHAVGVAMDETGDGRMGIFTAGVGHFPGGGIGFFDAGDDLPADGAIFVRRVNEVEEVGGDGQREFGVGQERAGAFLGGERGHEALELLDRGDAVLELPAPVIPILVGNVAPEAAAGGTKLFEGIQLGDFTGFALVARV